MVHRAELLHPQHFARYYQKCAPAKALLPWVDHYWFLKSYAEIGDDVSESHFPRLAEEWVFLNPNHQTNSNFNAVRQETATGVRRGPLSALTPFVYAQNTLALGVRFQAGVGLGSQLMLDAAQQLPWSVSVTDFAEQVAWLDRYLTARLVSTAIRSESRKQRNMRWQCQQSLMLFERPDYDVQDVAEQLHLSPRSLQRHFKQVLGISPKQAQRQVRLRKVLEDRWSESTVRSGELLWQYYTDPSHFYKSFQQVCQQSFRSFLQTHQTH